MWSANDLAESEFLRDTLSYTEKIQFVTYFPFHPYSMRVRNKPQLYWRMCRKIGNILFHFDFIILFALHFIHSVRAFFKFSVFTLFEDSNKLVGMLDTNAFSGDFFSAVNFAKLAETLSFIWKLSKVNG